MRAINNRAITGCMCALGCEAIFGLSYIFTKTGTEDASAFALLGWRFLIAVVGMSICVVLGFIKIDLRGKSLKPLLLVALFSPCTYFIGETIGISNTTASESGIFLACIPIFSLIASTMILRKKPSKIQIIGIMITLAGVIVTVISAGASSSFSIYGYVFLMIAVISYALYSAYVDKANDYTGAEITYVMLIAGAVVFVVIAILEAMINGTTMHLVTLPVQNSAFLAAVLYQSLCCSILAFFLSNVAIARIGVNRTSSFIGIATVVSIVSGTLILKETISGSQIAGAVIILIGVYIANAKMTADG